MGFQNGLIGESQSALDALEGLVAGVRTLVRQENRLIGKTHFAFETVEGILF